MEKEPQERLRELIDIVMSQDSSKVDVWHALMDIKHILESGKEFLNELYSPIDLDALYEAIRIITMHHKVIPQKYIDIGFDDWNDLLKDIRSKLK